MRGGNFENYTQFINSNDDTVRFCPKEIGSPWRCLGGNAQYNSFVGVDYDLDISSSEILWEKKLAFDNRYREVSSLVSDGDSLFLAHLNNVMSLDMSTGNSKWVKTIGCMKGFSTLFGEISTFNDSLYFITYDGSELYSFSPIDGSVNWVSVAEENGLDYFVSPPVVLDGHVVCNTFSTTCLSEETGRLIWQVDSGQVWPIPVIINDSVVINPAISDYLVLSLYTGSTKHNISTKVDNTYLQASIADNKMIIPYDGCKIKLYDAETFKEIRTIQVCNETNEDHEFFSGERISYDGKHIVIFGFGRKLTCFDNNGNKLWQVDDIKERFSSSTGPIIVNSCVHIFHLDRDSDTPFIRIEKIDITNGRILQSKNFDIEMKPNDKTQLITYGIYASGKFFFTVGNTIYCIGIPE